MEIRKDRLWLMHNEPKSIRSVLRAVLEEIERTKDVTLKKMGL